MQTLAPRTLLALAAAADVAPDTVRRRLDGRPMRHSTRARVEAAARKLRVRLPRVAAAAMLGLSTAPEPPFEASPDDGN